MIYAKFVKGDEVVIPVYMMTEAPRTGDVVSWENRRFRVLGPPIRTERLQSWCQWFMQPVFAVTEVPADTHWLPRPR